ALAARPRRQLRDVGGRAGRWNIADVPAVDVVHSLEVVEVAQVDGGLHDPVEAAARGLQDRAQVREHLLGLLGDAVTDELASAGRQSDLPGDEDEAPGPGRLP